MIAAASVAAALHGLSWTSKSGCSLPELLQHLQRITAIEQVRFLELSAYITAQTDKKPVEKRPDGQQVPSTCTREKIPAVNVPVRGVTTLVFGCYVGARAAEFVDTLFASQGHCI